MPSMFMGIPPGTKTFRLRNDGGLRGIEVCTYNCAALQARYPGGRRLAAKLSYSRRSQKAVAGGV